ncbi:MAG: lipopolysaccharide heptosyltransferase I [Halioglobus sp.]
MRVLIVKMSSLGDVIHTLPALSDATRAVPGIQFDWVVEEAFAEIPQWHPAVDKVIPIALRRWRKNPFRDFRGPEWREFRQTLKSGHYDAVIDAQGLIKSATVARMVKAPIFGMDKHSARERLATLAYHHKTSVSRDLHAVERSRMLFAKALGYAVPENSGDYGLREHLHPSREQLAPSLLFFHGTARAEKLWSESRWLELSELVVAAGYGIWLPWGDEAERARAQRIAAACPQAQVLPKLDLRGMASMLFEVDGAVALDTGLGHLAAALDVPAVSLYGPTDTRLIGAYGDNQIHIQSPLGTGESSDPTAMMSSITAPMVWDALQPLLPVRDKS